MRPANSGRAWLLAWLAGVSTFAPAADAPPPPETLKPPAGWTLAWSDEFDVDGLPDPRKWANDTYFNKRGWFNHEQQYYAGPRAENAVVHGGRLLITARRETPSAQPDWGGQKYTSARLFTRGLAQWTYGFFEIRARLPCGLGTWPAIWMLGSHGDWPANGELDIMEHIGRNPGRVMSTVHTPAVAATTVSAGIERRYGQRPTSRPSTGPTRTEAITITVRSVAASCGVRPSPCVRNG